MNRRNFLQKSVLAGSVSGIIPAINLKNPVPPDKVRLGFIGVGMRGFIEAIKHKVAPPIAVYDTASWSAISPLSELSIARGSSPVEIPDFTRGKWRTNKRIFGLNGEY